MAFFIPILGYNVEKQMPYWVPKRSMERAIGATANILRVEENVPTLLKVRPPGHISRLETEKLEVIGGNTVIEKSPASFIRYFEDRRIALFKEDASLPFTVAMHQSLWIQKWQLGTDEAGVFLLFFGRWSPETSWI